MADAPHLICTHVYVPEMQESGSAVRFDFQCMQANAAGEPLPGEKMVQVWIPLPVLESIAGVLPQVLEHMRQREAAAAAADGTGKH